MQLSVINTATRPMHDLLRDSSFDMGEISVYVKIVLIISKVQKRKN